MYALLTIYRFSFAIQHSRILSVKAICVYHPSNHLGCKHCISVQIKHYIFSQNCST